MNGGSRLVCVDHFPGDRRRQSNGLQQCDDLRPSGCVAKTHEGKRCVSSHERRGIIEHLEQCLVKACAGGVLPKNPGVGVSDFFHVVCRETHEIGIPLSDRSVVTRHSFAHLDERMLDVARMCFFVQIFRDFLVGKMAAKPGVPPEQERHQDDQPPSDEEQDAVPR